MKKRLITLLLTFIFVLFASIPLTAFADTYDALFPRLIDYGNLLTDKEEYELSNKLNEISERQQFDVVIATVFGLDGKTPQQYADDYYDYYQYGFGENRDGALLLVNMQARDWYITTTGYGKVAITDAGLECMSELFLDDLSNGNYYDSFITFAELCDDYVTEARNGTPYDEGHLPSGKFNFLTTLIISLVIGLVIALIVVAVLKGQLKSVRFNTAADEYVVPGSMNVSQSRDTYLYSRVSKTPRETNSSSSGGSSSSGSSHGGGGGKF